MCIDSCKCAGNVAKVPPSAINIEMRTDIGNCPGWVNSLTSIPSRSMAHLLGQERALRSGRPRPKIDRERQLLLVCVLIPDPFEFEWRFYGRGVMSCWHLRPISGRDRTVITSMKTTNMWPEKYNHVSPVEPDHESPDTGLYLKGYTQFFQIEFKT